MQLLLALTSFLAVAHAQPTIQRRAATCGVTGYDKNSPNAYYFASGTNAAACAALCTSQTGCNSFASGNNNCLLYTSAVADNFVSNPSSGYVFNDISCVSPVAAVGAVAANAQTCGTTTVTVAGSASTVTVSANPVTVTAAGSASTATVTVAGSAVTITAAGSASTATVTVAGSAVTVTSTVSAKVTVSATVTNTATVTVTKTCANPLGVGC